MSKYDTAYFAIYNIPPFMKKKLLYCYHYFITIKL